MGYTLLKFIHILLAIVAIGFNASYAIWLTRARREPEHALHVLRGIKTLDDRFANPAYAFLLVSGIGLVLMSQGGWRFEMFWISAAIALYVVVVVLAAFLYSPTLRKQIGALEAQGAESDEYQRLSSRGRILGIVIAVLVVTIEFLMVAKPTL